MLWEDDDYDRDEDSPAEWRRIFWGLLGAAVCGYFAYKCFSTGETTFWQRPAPFEPKEPFIVRGSGAVAEGYLWVFGATYLHFHYFWAYFPMLGPLRGFMKSLSFIGGVAALAYFLWFIYSHPKEPAGAYGENSLYENHSRTFVSMISVTGPSFTRLTCIIAPKRPV